MNWLFFIIIIIFFVIFFKKEKVWEGEEKENLPYKKRVYLFTRTENRFFKILEEVVAGQYYIFPQLNLDKLILVKNGYSNNYSYKNKIDRKSVDFVLFDKQNISPVLVIELDDYTHEREDRKERDLFVNKVFKKSNIPILRINSIPKKEDLKEQIRAKV